jgi:hypothetical protein
MTGKGQKRYGMRIPSGGDDGGARFLSADVIGG